LKQIELKDANYILYCPQNWHQKKTDTIIKQDMYFIIVSVSLNHVAGFSNSTF